MKYLMLVCFDPSAENDEKDGEIDAWLEQAGDRRIIGEALQPPRTATTVRVRRRERLITDGPFAETKEIVVGFDVVECDSQEEAVELAAAHPVARFGAIEVRPFMVWDEA